MTVVFSPVAETDLEEIGDYIALANPRRAVTFVREIRDQDARLSARLSRWSIQPAAGG